MIGEVFNVARCSEEHMGNARSFLSMEVFYEFIKESELCEPHFRFMWMVRRSCNASAQFDHVVM